MIREEDLFIDVPGGDDNGSNGKGQNVSAEREVSGNKTGSANDIDAENQVRKRVSKTQQAKKDDTGLFKKYKGNEETVIVPDGTTGIVDKAFAGNTTVKKVIVSEGVKAIGSSAFEGCTSLEEIVLPDTVEEIGEKAFKNCTSLRSFILPGNTVNIFNSTFEGCSEIESIIIHGNCKWFGLDAFKGMGKAVLYIPEGTLKTEKGPIMWIGLEMALKKIVHQLPEGMEWPRCTYSEAELKRRQETLIYKNELLKYTGDLEEYIVPTGIKAIGYNAFLYNKTLKRIILTNSLTSIGIGAFEKCENLESIEIPYGIKMIQMRTFKGCSSLKYVTLPDSVTTVENEAFSKCYSLRSINIPSGIKRFMKMAVRSRTDPAGAFSGLVAYGVPGSKAEEAAFHAGIRFQGGLPEGVPLPRTADSADPTVDASE